MDREKVIKGLECCMVGDGHSPKCELCPYATVGDDTCQTMDELFTDALALLKAQEPRVMTLEEVQVSANPVWLEGGMAGGTWAMMPKTLERSIEFVGNGVFTLYPAFAIDEYGRTWRCWTSRPDENTREETPWNAQN